MYDVSLCGNSFVNTKFFFLCKIGLNIIILLFFLNDWKFYHENPKIHLSIFLFQNDMKINIEWLNMKMS